MNTCKEKKEERLAELIERTQKKIPQIEKLNSMYRECLNIHYNEPGARKGKAFTEETTKRIQDNCEPLQVAIEFLKDEIPWIRGEKFQKIAVKAKPNPRN